MWHPVRFSEGEPVSGEVLVSFSVSQIEYNYMFEAPLVNLRSRVKLETFDVSLLILGLRNLQSSGILPVKKAFI